MELRVEEGNYCQHQKNLRIIENDFQEGVLAKAPEQNVNRTVGKQPKQQFAYYVSVGKLIGWLVLKPHLLGPFSRENGHPGCKNHCSSRTKHQPSWESSGQMK